MRHTNILLCAVLWGTACTHGEAESTEPSLYDVARQNELETGRAKFIADSRARLVDLRSDIEEVREQMAAGSDRVDSKQRADWSQSLFEIEQEEARLEAEIERARTASLEEWAAMRGDVKVAIDQMEASIIAMTKGILSVFMPAAARSGMCALHDPDAVLTVHKTDASIVVLATARQTKAIERLQEGGKEMARAEVYRAGQSTSEEFGREIPIEARISTRRVDEGVEVSLTPAEIEVDALYEQVARDVEDVAAKKCPEPSTPASDANGEN